MGIIECCQSFLQPFAPAAIKVDSRTHTSRIHLGKVMLDSLGRQSSPFRHQGGCEHQRPGNPAWTRLTLVIGIDRGCQSRSFSSLMSSFCCCARGIVEAGNNITRNQITARYMDNVASVGGRRRMSVRVASASARPDGSSSVS